MFKHDDPAARAGAQPHFAVLKQKRTDWCPSRVATAATPPSKRACRGVGTILAEGWRTERNRTDGRRRERARGHKKARQSCRKAFKSDDRQMPRTDQKHEACTAQLPPRTDYVDPTIRPAWQPFAWGVAIERMASLDAPSRTGSLAHRAIAVRLRPQDSPRLLSDDRHHLDPGDDGRRGLR